jgi:hypothetical protein
MHEFCWRAFAGVKAFFSDRVPPFLAKQRSVFLHTVFKTFFFADRHPTPSLPHPPPKKRPTCPEKGAFTMNSAPDASQLDALLLLIIACQDTELEIYRQLNVLLDLFSPQQLQKMVRPACVRHLPD